MSKLLNPNNDQSKHVKCSEYRVKVLNTGLKSARRFPLPRDLKSAFPVRRNPLYEEHQEHLLELANWVLQYGKLAQVNFEKVASTGLFAAFFWCFCEDIQRFETVFCLMLNVFIHDDGTGCKHGDSDERIDQCIKVWRDFDLALDRLLDAPGSAYIPMTYWDPSVLSMHAIHEKICHGFNREQRRRFVGCWKEYIQGNIDEIEFIRSKRTFKSVDDFLLIREKSIGFLMVIQLLEYTDNMSIEDSEWNDPDIMRWLRLAAKATIFDNDIWSFEMEYLAVDEDMTAMFNLVAIIALVDSCPIAEAMEKVLAMNVEIENEMQVLSEKITARPQCRAVFKTFIKKAGYIVGGNDACSALLDRYHKFN